MDDFSEATNRLFLSQEKGKVLAHRPQQVEKASVGKVAWIK